MIHSFSQRVENPSFHWLGCLHSCMSSISNRNESMILWFLCLLIHTLQSSHLGFPALHEESEFAVI